VLVLVLVLVLLIASSHFLFSLSRCSDHFTPNHSDGLCGIQGFLLMISVLTNAFYFFFICLNLFLLVVLEVHVERLKWYPWVMHGIGLVSTLHPSLFSLFSSLALVLSPFFFIHPFIILLSSFFSQGFPITFAVIDYAAQKFEFIFYWCLVSNSNLGWEIPTLFFWLGFFVTVNAVMVPVIFFKLYWVAKPSPVCSFSCFLLFFPLSLCLLVIPSSHLLLCLSTLYFFALSDLFLPSSVDKDKNRKELEDFRYAHFCLYLRVRNWLGFLCLGKFFSTSSFTSFTRPLYRSFFSLSELTLSFFRSSTLFKNPKLTKNLRGL
jgi:hypothetical protein